MSKKPLKKVASLGKKLAPIAFPVAAIANLGVNKIVKNLTGFDPLDTAKGLLGKKSKGGEDSLDVTDPTLTEPEVAASAEGAEKKEKVLRRRRKNRLSSPLGQLVRNTLQTRVLTGQ